MPCVENRLPVDRRNFPHALFDEYRIGLVPLTLGAGNPLFKPDSEALRLELRQSRPLGERCLLLRYQPAARP